MRGLWSRRGRSSGIGRALCVVAGTALLATPPALAQAKDPNTKQAADPNIEKLQKEIQQRDALIHKLARRLDMLERRVRKDTTRPGASSSVVTLDLVRRVDKLEQQVHRNASRPGAPPALITPAVATSQAPRPALAADMVAQAADQPAPPPAGPPPSTAAPPAPGQFTVSPEAAERALERTLIATGNLLVPAGFAEVEPIFSYTRRETPTLVLFNVNRNEFAPTLDLRLGLPLESQLEVAVPWNFDEQQVTNVAVSPQQLVSDRWGNSIGDVNLSVAKTLLHEKFWIPTLLGRVTWEAPTGPTSGSGVPLPSGQDKVAFSLTAVKRQDPLVFVGTAGYTKAITANRVNPGDQFNFTTGAFLATSPETTLRGVLTENFLQDVSVNGVRIPGSNTVQPILSFGASTILGRGILVDLQVGFGLTNSAPKYTVILSSTYRFNTPHL